jgi:hypothetical protein
VVALVGFGQAVAEIAPIVIELHHAEWH